MTSNADLEQSPAAHEPKSDDRGGLLLLGGEEDVAHSVQKYEQDIGWQKCADSLKLIYYSAVASNSTHVFVVDGWNLKGHIQVYDVTRDTWSVIENVLKTPRYGATATIIDNKLYVSGGYDREDYLSSTEVFAISGSSCTPCDDSIPDLKAPRHVHASVTRGDEIFFVGGCSSDCDLLSSFESINISSCVGTELPPLQQARSCPAAILYEDSLVVMGGEDDRHQALSSTESYFFDVKQWTMMVHSMTAPRFGHCAAVHKGQILVIGGWNDSAPPDSIEVYDPETKQWHLHSTLSIPRLNSSLVTLCDR